MSKYTETLKLAPEGESINISKLYDFLTGDLVNLNLVPVSGQYDTYWLSGKDGYDLIDGNKYYKLTFTSTGINITCKGGYNAFSMVGHLKQWFVEGVKKRKEVS